MKETNQNHLISASTEQKMLSNQRKISFGTSVEILKGPSRGCKGKIIGSTNDGVFFFLKDFDSVQKDNRQFVEGPYLGCEFKILS
ncbi:hypothetical protein HRE53_29025 (plasmid) [Acaryochloris sp. 'Moss Beach']|uniref:hypothetical protein n=1 Tax=Acaryochloris TaxID=155977 RepID=UPI001BAEE589|nr:MULTISPECIES: hypothetical protein [Acaryochloris]QUY46045.1 hypothetical protein I1H34_30495 [Acaryochloris marina S15]UJB72618.1 hypothetical protein HRE53_29025 [Acaryochloris sp. 'Moss Beach']